MKYIFKWEQGISKHFIIFFLEQKEGEAKSRSKRQLNNLSNQQLQQVKLEALQYLSNMTCVLRSMSYVSFNFYIEIMCSYTQIKLSTSRENYYFKTSVNLKAVITLNEKVNLQRSSPEPGMGSA